ncbi:MAG: hypothetical protein FWC03_07870 [Treponema sp.]|nr:hypothetical protein [Treponema sp.]
MMKNIHFFLVGVCLFLGACSTGEAASAAISQMFGGSSQALLFINCKAVSEDEIEFEFSQPVTVKFIGFDPVLSVASIESGSTVKVKLEESLASGLEFTADLLAEDADKNTINVLVPFRSRNNRMPLLVINELCTENAASNTGKKPEFIEFKMKSDGNLGAMRVFILGNTNASQKTIYEFKPVEVKRDDYVTLHLRTVGDECIDEYGENLNESGGKDASPTGRDFWVPGNTKLIHKDASAVYVLDQDDNVLDAVMISSTPDVWWKKEYFAEAAGFLHQQDKWKSIDGSICSPAGAAMSDKATNTRTICRDETREDSNTAADWYITVTSGTTPGKPNNRNKFSN